MLGKAAYRSVYGKTYSEVKAKLRELASLQSVIPPPKDDPLFNEVLRQWREANRLNHKGATEAKYDYLIEKHISPELGKLRLSAITTLTLNAFAEKKLKNGRLDKKGGLSAAYVRGMMIVVASALKYAVAEGLCAPLKTSAYKPPIEKRELEILSDSEQLVLERFLLSGVTATKFGVFLSLSCGLRLGEICALQWENIDLENRVIRIKSTVARVKGSHGGSLVIETPKTKSSLRDVPIHSDLVPIIRKVRTASSSPYVVSDKPEFVSPRTFEYRYHRLLKRCGLRAYNYHTLRHTFATKCIAAGVDVKTLSEILGHSNVSITLNTYVHPSHAMKLKQLEKISIITA